MFALTNSDAQGQDGTGAQVLRFLIHLALSRKYQIPFRYQDIKKIDSNPGDSFQTHDDKLLFLKKLNLVLSKDLMFIQDEKVFFLRRIFGYYQLHFLLSCMKLLSKLIKPRFLVSFNNCVSYSPLLTEYFTEYTSQILEKSTLSTEQSTSSQFTTELHIAVHLRGALKTDQRFEPAELYALLSWIQGICEEEQVKTHFLLHTDVPRNEYRWAPLADNYTGTLESWKKFNLLDQDGIANLVDFDFEANFKDLLSFKVIREIDPIDAWSQISKCQVFIGCNSSFSIVASLLSNPLITILPPIDNFAFPKDWIQSTLRYELHRSDKVKIVRKIRDYSLKSFKESESA